MLYGYHMACLAKSSLASEDRCRDSRRGASLAAKGFSVAHGIISTIIEHGTPAICAIWTAAVMLLHTMVVAVVKVSRQLLGA